MHGPAPQCSDHRPLRILVAPSGFKEGLPPEAVCAAIAAGVHAVCASAQIDCLPVPDGGEGFAGSLVRATGGSLRHVTVTGPLGEPVASRYGILGDGETAVVELAESAGLRLIPPARRDALRATTRGVGETIRAALDAGFRRILVGCGDSGTNDGGAGLAQALGVRLERADGTPIGPGAAGLLELQRIDLSARDPRIVGAQIEVACNHVIPLTGPAGTGRSFGAQKGAPPAALDWLDLALSSFAAIVRRDLGINLAAVSGAGASGGAGAGLHALLGARLRSRYDVVDRLCDLDRRICAADIVFTAEGRIDAQSPQGKVPAEIGRRAAAAGIPVIAMAGALGAGATHIHAYGVDAVFSIAPGPSTLDAAMAATERRLTACAANVMRTLRAGIAIGARRHESRAA